MTEPTFIEQHIDEEFWNWKYQYYSDDFDSYEMYEWCLSNLGWRTDWYVRFSGVIIRTAELAMAFKLRWM